MHVGAAELLGGDVLAGGRLHQRRAAEEDAAGAAHHDRLVAERRQVGAARGAVAETSASCGMPGRAQQALAVEDVAAAVA